MDYSKELIEKYTIDADKRVSLVCRIMIVLMVLVVVLEYTEVFIVDKLSSYIAAGISIVNFFLPTLMYDILKTHKPWCRYCILALLVFQSGIQYVAFSYHTVLMLCFPTVMACLYNKPKYMLYSCALSVPMIALSHVISSYLQIVFDDPLTMLWEVMLYGFFPRAIEYGAISVVCYFISSRIHTLTQTLAEKNNQLYEDQNTTIASLSEIIESRSRHTGHHVKRVAEYTAILCRGLGYSESEVWKVSRAAMMHDVGKICVSSEIINKPGKLTEEELDEVKKHVEYGRQMLEKAPGELFKISTEIAYQHHEKWDGSGYLGMKGEQINEFARCVALADVFDALVSVRPYKKAWTVEAAREEILSQRGKHFDPRITDVFEAYFNEFKEILEKYPDTL